MSRYCAFADRFEDGRAHLADDEAHHLVRVRRFSEGDLFEATDGKGRRCLCRLQRDGAIWFGKVLEEVESHSESPFRIVLAQALLKSDKFEWVLQKATELGVAEIAPIVTKRTEVKLDPRRTAGKLNRWRRILVEAVKQCGRSRVPALSEPVQLHEFVATPRALPLWALDEEASESLSQLFRRGSRPSGVVALVGPEGGWDPDDRRILGQAAAVSVRLGPRILRAETAPVAFLSILQHLYGDLS